MTNDKARDTNCLAFLRVGEPNFLNATKRQSLLDSDGNLQFVNNNCFFKLTQAIRNKST